MLCKISSLVLRHSAIKSLPPHQPTHTHTHTHTHHTVQHPMLQSPQRPAYGNIATKFKEFLDEFQNEPSSQHLETRLENIYQELSELFTSHTAPFTSIPFSLPPTPCTPCTSSNPSLTMSSQYQQHLTPNSSIPFPQPRTAKLQRSLEQPTTPYKSGTGRWCFVCMLVCGVHMKFYYIHELRS